MLLFLEVRNNRSQFVGDGGYSKKKLFKDDLWCLYNNWLVAGNHPSTGKIKIPFVTELGNWVKSAWGSVPLKFI